MNKQVVFYDEAPKLVLADLAARIIPPIEDGLPTMRVVHQFPPNWKDIVRVFPQVRSRVGMFFCWDKIIYAPTPGSKLTGPLLAHETMHSRRQDGKPQAWWDAYLVSKDFRLAEELLAHQAEYIVQAENANRHYRRQALKSIATRLSGKLYGSMVTLDRAKAMIQGQVGAQ